MFFSLFRVCFASLLFCSFVCVVFFRFGAFCFVPVYVRSFFLLRCSHSLLLTLPFCLLRCYVFLSLLSNAFHTQAHTHIRAHTSWCSMNKNSQLQLIDVQTWMCLCACFNQIKRIQLNFHEHQSIAMQSIKIATWNKITIFSFILTFSTRFYRYLSIVSINIKHSMI